MAHDEPRFLVAGERLESLLEDEKLRSRRGAAEAEVVLGREVNVITRREGVDRLQAAMRSGGALDRDIPFEDVVDNSLAEAAAAAA